MDNIPSSPRAVPSIHILNADDNSALFDSGWFSAEMCNNSYNAPEDTGLYPCSPGPQSEHLLSHSFPELDEMSEFSHLATTNQAYLTGPGFSIPYSGIMQDSSAMAAMDGGLTPSSLGSPIPSPSSSFGGSLSPSSFYDSSALSDTETPLSPSPTTPDEQFLWPTHGLSHPFIGSFSSDSLNTSDSLGPQSGPHRPRSHSSPSSRRGGPVASKAMLEANGRRRRHPAQFVCPDCQQTFTALFSLKRHAQSHTGERPFACGIPGCTQRFFNSSDCKRHEKSRKRHKDVLMQ